MTNIGSTGIHQEPFLGQILKAKLENFEKVGWTKGPASRWTAGSFNNLLSTASGCSWADNKLGVKDAFSKAFKMNMKTICKTINKIWSSNFVISSQKGVSLLIIVGVGRSRPGTTRLVTTRLYLVTKITFARWVCYTTFVTLILKKEHPRHSTPLWNLRQCPLGTNGAVPVEEYWTLQGAWDLGLCTPNCWERIQSSQWAVPTAYCQNAVGACVESWYHTSISSRLSLPVHKQHRHISWEKVHP